MAAGHMHPQLFEAIWQGETSEFDPNAYGVYLFGFVSTFTNAEDAAECHRVVGPGIAGRLAAIGTAAAVGGVIESLGQLHGRPGSRTDRFITGTRTGAETVAGMAAQELGGRHDAQRFYSRHGCNTADAHRFFRNFVRFIAQ